MISKPVHTTFALLNSRKYDVIWRAVTSRVHNAQLPANHPHHAGI